MDYELRQARHGVSVPGWSAYRSPPSCGLRPRRSGALLESVNEQLKQADDELAQLVKDDPVVKRLTSAPGVGPVTAACFVATLDDARASPTPNRRVPISVWCLRSTVPASDSKEGGETLPG